MITEQRPPTTTTVKKTIDLIDLRIISVSEFCEAPAKAKQGVRLHPDVVTQTIEK